MKFLQAWVPLVLLLCLGTVLGLALLGGADPSAVASPLTGKPAPALDIPLLDQNGARLTGQAMKGKPHLLNFFASWCGPCAAENALLLDLAGRHEIEIDGVAMKDNAEPLRAYLEKRGNPYDRVGLDENGRTAIDWGVSGVPETFAIDASGTIVGRHIGELNEDDEARLLKALQVAGK